MAKGIGRLRKPKSAMTRITAVISDEAASSLVALQKQRPLLYINQVVADAITFAYINQMYDPAFIFDIPGRRKVDPIKAIVLTKKQLCERYGATVEGTTVSFVRYEQVPIGIMKNKVSLPINSLPDDEDGIRKIMIGSFKSVEEAEMRYQEEQEEKSHAQPAPESL